jgi:hypothetical protein
VHARIFGEQVRSYSCRRTSLMDTSVLRKTQNEIYSSSSFCSFLLPSSSSTSMSIHMSAQYLSLNFARVHTHTLMANIY